MKAVRAPSLQRSLIPSSYNPLVQYLEIYVAERGCLLVDWAMLYGQTCPQFINLRPWTHIDMEQAAKQGQLPGSWQLLIPLQSCDKEQKIVRNTLSSRLRHHVYSEVAFHNNPYLS